MSINVIGAGLAGCEAAFQIAKRNIHVNLYEMKPEKKTPAHKSDKYAELVCSNSFKADHLGSAAGLLKAELRILDSLLIRCADKAKIPAGSALAVDRDIFSGLVTEEILNNSNITVFSKEIEKIPMEGMTIIAAGPLVSEPLSADIAGRFNGALSFYDASAPIVALGSIDMNSAYFASRYGKGDGDDYLNCPLSKEEYDIFYNALISAERAPVHGADIQNPNVYEGCIPVEILARRGYDTLRFGAMKPVGLTNPSTEARDYAVLQLRKENSAGSLYNLVGFQTNLKWGAQKEVFGLIPALKKAEFVRYGVMHRNTFIDSPRILNADFSTKKYGNIFFAGQITGVEGYMESVFSGLFAGINTVFRYNNIKPAVYPEETVSGSLCRYISDETIIDFQPIGANFGILPPLDGKIKDKKQRGQAYSERSLSKLKEYVLEIML